METNAMSPADIMALSNDGGFGGGSSWIIIILFLLVFGAGGFGGGYGANGYNVASTADLQRAVDLNSIQEGQATINGNIQRTAYEQIATTKDVAYNNLSEIRDLQGVVSAGFAGMQTCCCGLDKSILENRYISSQNTSAIMANDTANTQKILDAISANRMADLQSRINYLETQNIVGTATANVVKYPNNTTYAVPSPCFSTGCGCGCGV